MASTVLDPPQHVLPGRVSAGSPTGISPRPAAGERGDAGREPAASQEPVYTFLMTDMVGSTQLATALGDHGWAELLTSHHATVRRPLHRHRGQEVGTTGDGFFAVFRSPAAAVVCAHAVIAALRDEGIEARAGLHWGGCVLVEGVPAGVAVHITARITARASAGQVLVSQPVFDRVAGSVVSFEEPSLHHLKGVSVPLWLFAAAAVHRRE
jgi:class 3 adenylate cyclase